MSFTAASDYNRLKNKPVVPTKTSEVTNDAGFVTASVRTNSAVGLTVEIRTSDPTSPSIGQMWYRKDLG